MYRKAVKLFHLLFSKLYRNALINGLVGAAIEHEMLLKNLNCNMVVDIGANKGQFSLVSRSCFPNAKIISFEPLAKPANIFRKVFCKDSDIVLHIAAIGPKKYTAKMHISNSEDSSSLLPISELQNEIFPGTSEIKTSSIDVYPLDYFLSKHNIPSSALLKLDVQGFEMDALRGCENLLSSFKFIYCECSFMELYLSQKLAYEVIEWLFSRGFSLLGVYNTSYDVHGISVQSDLMFVNKKCY